MTKTELTVAIGDQRVPALGVGTWALGGDWDFDGKPAGWGAVDDTESIAALRAAYEGGVRLIDTADVYGCGHSERVVGRAVAPFRDDVLIATKVGLLFDEEARTGAGEDLSPAYIRRACEASLRRLGVDHIDVYQVHPGGADPELARSVVATFEELVTEGKIRAYGTSATESAYIEAVAAGEHGVSVQQELNVFSADAAALEACERHDLAVLARTPLAMGLLSGRYTSPEQLPAGDVRRNTPWWTWFDADRMPEWLERIDAVRELLTSDGRTLVQGALGYVWARSGRAVALPGVRTVAQAKEQAGALAFGPLDAATMADIDARLQAPS
ncbi:aldo/keto reductase [Pseudonocardia sp. CA-107938]|uniref:aldo/keto reductase n=1 Tax=Pseudonocardia sp. CA-107938 TaxID=3240021 RepID=UPI003D9331F4